ncbi:hypothetical protein EMIT0P265_60249 [Pseudomonas zeae]
MKLKSPSGFRAGASDDEVKSAIVHVAVTYVASLLGWIVKSECGGMFLAGGVKYEAIVIFHDIYLPCIQY